jgi:hypothetical protein
MMGQHATPRQRRRLLGAVTALACCLGTTVSAEVRVAGDLNALRVSASGDTLSDVLSAFGTLFPVKYRTSLPLTGEVNGAYSGSFSQVVSRLLDGYNYVIKKDQGLTEILVFGKKGEAMVPLKAPIAKGDLSRWR